MSFGAHAVSSHYGKLLWLPEGSPKGILCFGNKVTARIRKHPVSRDSATLYRTLDNVLIVRAVFVYSAHGSATVVNLQSDSTALIGGAGAGAAIRSPGIAAHIKIATSATFEVPEDRCNFSGVSWLKTFEIQDMPGLTAAAQERSVIFIVDSIWPLPPFSTCTLRAFPSSLGHQIWKRDFTCSPGLFSVLISTYDSKNAGRMLDGLKIFGMGFSWDASESLIM
ncbi:hypothetical protein CGC20_10610 [Leishmania donovani]|uniref:Uncharacterized protein n=1 Tax=Leishmania donovani TaxID=5661 RepID=A0A504Y9F5_LEIDO|nr:hypothetical protein CGC20_10610 [Leishmania donovani]